MKILMLQPNYHCGGAEIAGNWPPSWSAYIGGALKHAGYTNYRFVDAMALDLPDAALADIIRANQPDIVMATAITPMIYKAQDTLKLVKDINPTAVTILGGIHPSFMYGQVLTEAPWIDYIVRGEGEEIIVNLLRTIEAGDDRRTRHTIRGIAFRDDEGNVVATPAHPPIADLDSLTPDWSVLDWGQYIYIPLNVRVAVPNFARGCPFTCRFCSQWKFWRKYRTRTPEKFVDEIEILVKEHQVGFFILADEEPTINQRKFVALCEALIARKLNVYWGINTRVTDILRDAELLPLYRRAGLVHVSLGTEAATQMNLNRFRKETTIQENKRAIQLLKANGMVAEAQFIMGLENETPETLKETYELALDWNPDMANWNMYTPWPFSELFEELKDRVEVRDYSRYNFVTPILQPDEMEREEVLKSVLKMYGKFYSRKALLEYPFIRDAFKRKYMLGCLKAFLKMTATKRFYDLGRVKRKGLGIEVDLGFDESRILSRDQLAALNSAGSPLRADVDYIGGIVACGGPRDLDTSKVASESPQLVTLRRKKEASDDDPEPRTPTAKI
ncbi:MAG: magnesium-protoporphyrin IX monomethyl ester anaerobic oxidative cyclase [Chloracidobacterium sp.]|nr:magnesium-protoporphyrin IX monomethyl ester anaerobic oxidative cyclase [Chloracidobacterium sp.]MDW8216664.1 magnesium-protoporphyrin IX monomethyl ester anaerobic oxidative cyclase [Acidobacteriota bacterium]